ncbi:hypothetical protein ACFL6I_05035 [candidate division KSB1 bacterium]
MEEILPFLLALAYIIYTLYKRGNKSKQKQKPAEVTESERKENFDKPDFKKVLEEILVGKEMRPEPVQEVFEEESDSIEATGDEILEQIPDDEVLAESLEEQKETVEREAVAEMNFYGESIEEESEFDFDLKKAIIYSEILRRPYL